ncbi:MAG: hypothetical protein ACPF9K_01435 [Neptuniibacter sp.]
MNKVLFNQVEKLAQEMMAAAEADNEEQFYSLYDQLKQLCQEHQGSKKDHPVLWETLGDFSEENDDAIDAYNQAYQLAEQMKDNEYKASIQYALAQRYLEEDRKTEAGDALEKAAKFASFTEDQELQEEIQLLVKSSG